MKTLAKKYTYILALWLATGHFHFGYTQQKASPPVTTLQLTPGPNNPRSSEGDFVVLKDGSILYVYSHFTGNSSSDFGNSHLAARWSFDNGNAWTPDDKIIVENEGAMNVMSVSLLRMKSGKIALFYARKNSIDDCIPYMRISDDEGKTWGKATKCITDIPGYYVLNNARIIQLPTGRLLMPVALHSSDTKEIKLEKLESAFNNYGKIFCYYSDDEGKSWKRSSQVNIPKSIMAQEPGLIELKDGSVMMYIRTDAGMQYVSYSRDKGQKWSPAIPSNIPSPLSPATIVRSPTTKDLLLVWNNYGAMNQGYNKRTPFNLAVSSDEGRTWKNVKTLQNDPDGHYCYTAARFNRNQELLLSYCAGLRSKGTGLSITNVTKLNLEWVYEK